MDVLAATGRPVEHLQLVVDTMALWFGAGYEAEGERRLEAALAAAPRSAPARAVGLVFLTWFVGVHDFPRAAGLAEEAVALARADGDDPVSALALMTLGDTAGNWQVECALCEQAAELAEHARDRPIRYAQAAADNIAGAVADQLSNLWRFRSLPAGIAWARRAVEHAERAGDDRTTAMELAELGYVHLLEGDLHSAGVVLARARALLTPRVKGRWEDTVALIDALLLQHTGRLSAAETAMREIIRSGLAGERPLLVYHASCHLVDLLLDRGRTEEADAVLRRGEELVRDYPDSRHATRLGARRARVLRLVGRPEDAAAVLQETARGIDPDQLSPEHVVWLVESALLAGTEGERRAWIERLDTLTKKTGVRVVPWERRWLEPDGVH